MRRSARSVDLFHRALAQHQAGDLNGAERLYRQSLCQDPDRPEALHYLGLLLRECGRLDEAIALLSRVVANNPADAPCQNNLGNMLREQGRLEEAITAYRAALRQSPGFANAHYHLGTALRDAGHTSAAMESYRNALRLAPDDAVAWNSLGNMLMERGNLVEALACFKNAVSLQPEFPEAHNNIGFASMSLGDMEAARASLRKAIELKPDLAEAYGNLVRTRRFGTGDNAEIARMEALVNNADLPDSPRVSLHFALGKVYDDCSAFEKAFDHYQSANRLQRMSLSFDREQHIDLVSRTIATFTEDFFGKRKGFGDPSERPIFIVGMLRSGTTLVEQIIASHPQVHGAGELTHITEIVAGLSPGEASSSPYPEGASLLDESQTGSLAEGYLEHLRSVDPNALRVTDKLPTNFLHLGLIALLFPRARIVHCRRDPLDICLSIYFQKFVSGQDYAYDLSDIAVFFRQYERLMGHWREVLPVSMYELEYEALVANGGAESRNLIAYCGLPWDDSCLRHHENKRPVQTASNWQVRQPLYTRSVERWRNYESFLGPLKRELGLG